jgi:hypothetical protein
MPASVSRQCGARDALLLLLLSKVSRKGGDERQQGHRRLAKAFNLP